MITADQRARIRRLYHAEHWKIGTIATELGLHRDTVRQALEPWRFATTARRTGPSVLDPYKDFVRQTLEQYPRLRATRLYEMVKSRGYAGSLIQLRRYVKTVRPAGKREAFLTLESLPGEQGQVDWGHFGTLRVGAAKRPLSCFVMVLSHSRAMYARFFLGQTMECFLRGHVEAFEYFGGAPRTLLYDNLKSAVLERDGDLIRFHPDLLALAGHYCFAPKPCAPYRGNEKGKVERAIQYLRHSFFAARRIHTLAELNTSLRQWLDEVAHARPRPRDPHGRLVRDVWAEETPVLVPLPPHPFGTELVLPVRSGKTPYIRFDKNDYSIPHQLVGESLMLIATEAQVRICDATHAVVATHARSYDRGALIEDPAHLHALAQHKRRAQAHTARAHLVRVCPHAEAFFAALCARDRPLAAHLGRLGRLCERYGAEALDRALAHALEQGAISAASVAHLLDQQQRQLDAPPPLEPPRLTDPRLSQVRVTPHSLAPYDQLARGASDPETTYDRTR